MSGIVGILHLDGAPVDAALVERLAGSLAWRGPDAQRTWAAGNVGFGHTLLRTTFEAEHEIQPCTLDGEVWITADARVDGREDLIRKLTGRGRHASLDRPDCELILQAYLAWGPECLEHLIGDFAFAIWDGRARRLFCARDHFGVKPFYYCWKNGRLVFSNTLNCVRQHPDVSPRLNDLAIADFLLFDLNRNPATTSFADIQRLPAAHALTVRETGLSIERYWTLPVEDPVYYGDRREYVQRFRALLRQAVSDRVRTNRVAIFMSGGLDSPGLAAATRDVLAERGVRDGLKAFTTVYDWLIPDQERHFAGLAAKALAIPIEFHVADNYKLYERWGDAELRTPEPVHSPTGLASSADWLKKVCAHARLALYAEGPDNLLHYECIPYVKWLVRNGMWRQLAFDGFTHLITHRRPPFVQGLLGHLRRKIQGRGEGWPDYPPWLAEEFASRLALGERWRSSNSTKVLVHPVRPVGYASMLTPLWQDLFESYDSGVSRQPLEVAHPYMDLRLARFLLAVPTIPWCRKKLLLRQAFRGDLPKEILSRRKAPLAGNPDYRRAILDGPPAWTPVAELQQYIDVASIPRGIPSDPDKLWVDLRPVSLNFWLQSL